MKATALSPIVLLSPPATVDPHHEIKTALSSLQRMKREALKSMQTMGYSHGHYPSETEMEHTLADCRANKWESVLKRVIENPRLAVTKLPMENHIITTVMHQAITAKGDTEKRANLILHILNASPRAAGIPNGYASYPLHSIAQRNTKMDAKTKETLIFALLKAYPDALLKKNKQGQRTPLHVLFTDYISPELTQLMIESGPGACFVRDKKGNLPAHIACSRHCSPEKLRMLLDVNFAALYAKTDEGQTLLSLAKCTATPSHPNKTLIDALEFYLSLDSHATSNMQTNDGKTLSELARVSLFPVVSSFQDGKPVYKTAGSSYRAPQMTQYERLAIPPAVSLDLPADEVMSNVSHIINRSASIDGHLNFSWTPVSKESLATPKRANKKRKAESQTAPAERRGGYDPGASLLLRLAARVAAPNTTEKEAARTLAQFAQV